MRYPKIFTKDFKNTRALLHRSIGVLLSYYLICSLFSQLVIFRLTSMLWSLALKAMPNNYISDSNFKEVFSHPLVIIIALVEAFIFCVVCIWQNTGLLMILESYRQDKPVKLLNILFKSFEQIKHVIKPKNWKIFILVVIILPLTDAQMSSSALSEIMIPEFIYDFILSRTYLALPFVLVSFLLVIFYFRYILVQQSFVLEQKDFRESAGTSIAAGRKNRIYLGISQTIVSLISMAVCVWLPIVLAGVFEVVVNVILKDYTYVSQITRWVMTEPCAETLVLIGSGYVKMYVMAFSLIAFHSICERQGVATDIKLVDGIAKTSGKIRPLKLWIRLSYVLIFTFVVGFTYVVTVFCEDNPEYLSLFTKDIKIAAHKGYSSSAPENTISAFEKAYQADSVDMIELDVRETSDGVPVVIHNENILEATGVNRSVYDISLKELQELNAAYGFKDEYPDEYIPTLEEVLMEYAGKVDLLIEIKYSDRTPDLPVKIAKMMEKYNITDTSLIHSGYYEAISKVKEYNPGIKCGFIMAFSTGGYYDMENADFFSIEHDFVTDNALDNAHLRGKKIFAWTVNNDTSMKTMKNTDVDMVITDYPDKCNEIILDTSNVFRDAIDNVEYNSEIAQYLNPDNYSNDNEFDTNSY